MQYMIIIYNYEDLQTIVGQHSVFFYEDTDEERRLDIFHTMMLATANGKFLGQVPTAYKAEVFKRDEDTWNLVSTFTPIVEREQALKNYYGIKS